MRYTISHNGETHNTPDLPEGYSLDNLKAQCVERWPEVANATMQVRGSQITFQLAQGNKA